MTDPDRHNRTNRLLGWIVALLIVNILCLALIIKWLNGV